jgi:EAL domain-containing protein (putative c-di-GMP-specific phosphodiesterase class I)
MNRARGCCRFRRAACACARGHLQDDELPGWLEDLLVSTDTPPGWLELEITESAIMTDTERAVKTLGAIRRLGINLSIDDYGTGYSSLAYLQKLAVNRLKIDKSFVAGLGHSEQDKVIVKSTIDLAHNLGLDVIAEGIETQAQYAMLQGMGCDYGQGYLIAEAMPPDLLVKWYALQQDHQARTPEFVSLDQRHM